MTRWKKHFEFPRVGRVEIGAENCLTIHTPRGLFEGWNGNRYLITKDLGTNLAIILSHGELEPFAVQLLTEEPLDFGTWRGGYRIRLTNASATGTPTKLGTIGICEKYVGLHCRTSFPGINWISLGTVGQPGLAVCDFYDDAFCDFDGWTIDPADAKLPFYAQSPADKPIWEMDVH